MKGTNEMKVLNVYVEGVAKNGEKVNTRAFNFPKNGDAMDILRTMKSHGFFNGWEVITAVYNLDNFKPIKEF